VLFGISSSKSGINQLTRGVEVKVDLSIGPMTPSYYSDESSMGRVADNGDQIR